MTKQEFQELQIEVSSRGRTLKSIFTERGVTYFTYNYRHSKIPSEEGLLPMALIAIKESIPSVSINAIFGEVEASDVDPAFLNGLRARFGRGSEIVLMELFDKSISHVLPE